MYSSKTLVIAIIFCSVNNIYSYFTLPGPCPDVLNLQEDFRLADFYGKWYQAYHYSSDGQNQSNCSTLELMTRPSGIYLNISRVDRGLFHRFSVGKLDIPVKVDDAARLDLIFGFKNAPRRLKTRRYPFHVLATNYNYYATVYTCQYSPLIDKHFVYVWILSRNPNLNEVSKELALKPLREIGIKDTELLKDEWDKCEPKYYEDYPAEPLTFRRNTFAKCIYLRLGYRLQEISYLYDCIYNEKTKKATELVWISVRDPHVHKNIEDAINAFVNANHLINLDKLVWERPSDHRAA